MFERFDERARSAVVQAQEEARTLGRGHVGSEHLLLGLVVEDARFSSESLAVQTLKSLGVSVDRVRASMRQFTDIAEASAVAGDGAIPLSREGNDALARALLESERLGHDWVGTGHILLALGRDPESVAARVLLDLDADPGKVWVTLRHLFLAGGGRRGGVIAQAGGALRSRSVTSTVASGLQVSLSTPVQRLGMSAAARALDDGRSQIELHDLLLALTSNETSASQLSNLGVDVQAMREAIERDHEATEPPDTSPEA